MSIITTFLPKVSLFAILAISSSSAFAGPTPPSIYMNYMINQTHAVPSLSASMLIVLSLLLFVVAFKIANQKNRTGAKLFISLLGVTALSMGASGIKLVSDTTAGDSVAIPHLTEVGRVHVDLEISSEEVNLFINGDYPQGITITGFETESNNIICGQEAFDFEFNIAAGARPSLAARHITVDEYQGPNKICGAITPLKAIRDAELPPLNGNVLNLDEACRAICIDTTATIIR